MTGPAGNSEFCFSLETLTKQNSLFPLGSVITAANGVTCIGYIFVHDFRHAIQTAERQFNCETGNFSYY